MYIHCICRCTPAACEFIYPVSRTTCIYPYPSADPPIMFANIPEENEDIPLISFDQSTQLGGHTTALDSTTDPLADGYVTGGGGSEFRSPTPTMVSSGFVSSLQPSSVSPSPSPTHLVVTSPQLTLTSQTTPSPPPPTTAATATLSPPPSHVHPRPTQLSPSLPTLNTLNMQM